MVRTASFLTVLEASAPFQVSFDNGPRSDIEQGITLRTYADFNRLEFINQTGDEITIKVGFGRGDVQDARLVISGAVNSKNISPGVFDTGAPVACANAATTALAAADGNRRELILACDEDAAAKVYIGGSAGAGAGEGLPLAPGQSLTLETAAAVYCRNDTGAAVAVAVAELGWL
jgi:hypothetical protein